MTVQYSICPALMIIIWNYCGGSILFAVADYMPNFVLEVLSSQYQLKVGGELVLFSVKPLFLDMRLPSRQLMPPKIVECCSQNGQEIKVTIKAELLTGEKDSGCSPWFMTIEMNLLRIHNELPHSFQAQHRTCWAAGVSPGWLLWTGWG